MIEEDKLIYTDEDLDDKTTVEEGRHYYIGGSECQKLMQAMCTGDIIDNILDKLSYVPVEDKGTLPEWSVFGNAAERYIRDYANKMLQTNYRPCVYIKENDQIRCNVDGFDRDAPQPLFECKTYSGKLDLKKYYAQVVFYMHYFGINSCVLVAFNKDILDNKGKKIRNITLEEINQEELEKRVSFHVIKLKDFQPLYEDSLMKAIDNYKIIYSAMKKSPIIKKLVEERKTSNKNQTDMIETFMEAFK